MRQILSNQTMLQVVPCARELPRPQAAGQLGGEQVDGIDVLDFANHVPSSAFWRRAPDPTRDGSGRWGDGEGTK
jgi:hypothetical protein